MNVQFQITSWKIISVTVWNVTVLHSLKKAIQWSGKKIENTEGEIKGEKIDVIGKIPI